MHQTHHRAALPVNGQVFSFLLSRNCGERCRENEADLLSSSSQSLVSEEAGFLPEAATPALAYQRAALRLWQGLDRFGLVQERLPSCGCG